MYKILLLILLTTPTLTTYAEDNPLSEYQWKSRLVVYSVPESELKIYDVPKVASQNNGELVERDMLFFDLNGRDTGPLFKKLTTEESAELKKAYKISDNEAVFILVGKDGGEKERLVGNLDLQYFFTKIDMMPMRIEEMGD